MKANAISSPFVPKTDLKNSFWKFNSSPVHCHQSYHWSWTT